MISVINIYRKFYVLSSEREEDLNASQKMGSEAVKLKLDWETLKFFNNYNSLLWIHMKLECSNKYSPLDIVECRPPPGFFFPIKALKDHCIKTSNKIRLVGLIHTQDISQYTSLIRDACSSSHSHQSCIYFDYK